MDGFSHIASGSFVGQALSDVIKERPGFLEITKNNYELPILVEMIDAKRKKKLRPQTKRVLAGLLLTVAVSAIVAGCRFTAAMRTDFRKGAEIWRSSTHIPSSAPGWSVCQS